jgi:hypothetical protein
MTQIHEKIVQVTANHSDVTVCFKEYSAMAHQFLITEASALHVEFVLDKLASTQVFLNVLRYSHVNYYSTSTLHSFIKRERVNEPTTVRSSTQTVSPLNMETRIALKHKWMNSFLLLLTHRTHIIIQISLTLKYPF